MTFFRASGGGRARTGTTRSELKVLSYMQLYAKKAGTQFGKCLVLIFNMGQVIRVYDNNTDLYLTFALIFIFLNINALIYLVVLRYVFRCQVFFYSASGRLKSGSIIVRPYLIIWLRNCGRTPELRGGVAIASQFRK